MRTRPTSLMKAALSFSQSFRSVRFEASMTSLCCPSRDGSSPLSVISSSGPFRAGITPQLFQQRDAVQMSPAFTDSLTSERVNLDCRDVNLLAGRLKPQEFTTMGASHSDTSRHSIFTHNQIFKLDIQIRGKRREKRLKCVLNPSIPEADFGLTGLWSTYSGTMKFRASVRFGRLNTAS